MEEKINFLNQDFDASFELDQKEELKIELDNELENALKELNDLQAQLPQEARKALLEQCKDSAIDAITSQFGLASAFIDARDGGSSTTLHNFEKGIDFISNDADRERFKHKNDYDRSGYDTAVVNGERVNFNIKRKHDFQNNETITDYATGRTLNKDGQAHLDHIISAKEMETDSATNLYLSRDERIELATSDENLGYMNASANSSKGEDDLLEWMNKADKETGATKGEKYGVDEELATKAYEKAQKHKKKTVLKAAIKKHATELAISGGKDALKMAAYSAIGMILKDVAQAVMIEIRTTLENKGNESFKEIFERFKTRMLKVWKNIELKWKDILSNSLEAGVTAFLSNIVVFVINFFATTLKRIVSIIRAGFVSLCQAVKMLANPPKDMPKDEVIFAALKILATGLIGAVSMGLTEGLVMLMKATPGLNAIFAIPIPFSGESIGDALAVCLTAMLGGVLSTVAIYYMDKCRNESKTSRLKICIMSQSGLITHIQIAKSWFVLDDAFKYSIAETKRTIEHISMNNEKANDGIKKSSENIEELKNLTNEAEVRLNKLLKGE
ncbi:hypothetical protein [Campylobacter magnus]|uniref:hypothetical protein n=1 Tax=Campylobacter magnus TaxID=3026462 RepID=UPI0026DF3BA4|nr:hypothetical protein [Campylobacter magnus]MDO2408370.1 hypothetical protein [Campylobacter magnus]